LDRFPRVRLDPLPTPLDPMAHLSAHQQAGLFACEPAFNA
jgi:1-aminocyclopropane-1-carboxylate deaminase/D-cysteine desulfhydrase-like pyridoxal-dependent ACC family enzyme